LKGKRVTGGYQTNRKKGKKKGKTKGAHNVFWQGQMRGRIKGGRLRGGLERRKTAKPPGRKVEAKHIERDRKGKSKAS